MTKRHDSSTPPAQVVSTLLGHSQMAVGAACLPTLLAHSRDPIALRVLDDGTLTPQDREELALLLPGVSVVDAHGMDERLETILARHPNCLAYRRQHPLARKLFDIVLLESTATVAYCDADVFFRRPFRDLFAALPDDLDALFLADRQNAYSVRSWELAITHRLKLLRGVNTGIILARSATLDLDALEWFFSHRRFLRTPVWAEQTAWSFLASRWRAAAVDRRQIRLAAETEVQGDDWVALHFVTPTRSLLRQVSTRSTDDDSPTSIQRRVLPPCRPWNLLVDELGRGATRWYSGLRLH